MLRKDPHAVLIWTNWYVLGTLLVVAGFTFLTVDSFVFQHRNFEYQDIAIVLIFFGAMCHLYGYHVYRSKLKKLKTKPD